MGVKVMVECVHAPVSGRAARAYQWGGRRLFLRSNGRSAANKSVCHRLEAAAPLTPQTASGCLVYPGKGQVRGVCHFLGGAFACAAPQAFYPLFIQSLVEASYTVIATPHSITFRHGNCVEELNERFWSGLEDMRASSLSNAVPPNVPIHGIGHSFGALLHVLMSSQCRERRPDTNVVISFNSRELTEAVPIPGLLDFLRLAVRAIPQSGPAAVNGLVRSILTQSLSLAPEGGLKDIALSSVDPLYDQLNCILRESREGPLDFDPTPSACQALIGESYGVASTLLVQFHNDTIDDTPLLARLLGNGRTELTEIVVGGNHLTPAGGDVGWLGLEPGLLPSESVAGIREVLQKDIYGLMDRILEWLDVHSVEGAGAAGVDPVQSDAQGESVLSAGGV
eukprot:evm.model.scf_1809.3 EVM.evm.TU.scf_1809.3   scf_1809:24395-26849(+)